MLYDKEESAKRAVAAFKAVFECGPKIELDHHLVYHARELLPFLYSSLYFFWRGEVDCVMWGAFDKR